MVQYDDLGLSNLMAQHHLNQSRVLSYFLYLWSICSPHVHLVKIYW